jgi:hypothetical protein
MGCAQILLRGLRCCRLRAWRRRRCRHSRSIRRRSLHRTRWRLGCTLGRLIENRSRLRFGHFGAHVRKRQAVDHEDGGKDRRGTRQSRARTASTEHGAGSPCTEAGARISPFAALKQHEADNGKRRENLNNCQNNSKHIRPALRGLSSGGQYGQELISFERGPADQTTVHVGHRE